MGPNNIVVVDTYKAPLRELKLATKSPKNEPRQIHYFLIIPQESGSKFIPTDNGQILQIVQEMVVTSSLFNFCDS